VGWTNVGKSTLLNRLVGEKLAAVGDAAQTTRRRILGVRNLPGRGQVVFVDTPGLHHPRHELNRVMVEEARRGLAEVDVALLVVDAARGLGAGDHEAAALTAGKDRRVVALNKVDEVRPKTKLLAMMQTASEAWGVSEIVPVSALTGEGCDTLLERLLFLLPESAPLYPDDFLTDQSERALAAEWIREQIVQATRQELPHATAVLIERWHERPDGLVEVEATVLVERESQKPIVIGQNGQMLRRVGEQARLELERLLGRRVFLRLWVKVREGWRDDDRTLHELGLA
jgi:GTP-binding protein Era